MGDWPIIGGGQDFETIGANTGTTAATYVGCSATPNTKGDWGEIIAATEFDACGLLVTMGGGTSTEFLYDIGIGSSGNEVIVIPNLHFGMATSEQYRNFASMFFPIAIPGGSRIAVRGQSKAGGDAKGFVMTLIAKGWEAQGFQYVETMGANTADSGGTSIDPGGTANSKGSYVEIKAATDRRIKALGIAFGQQDNSLRTACYWLVDIAIGASASEKVIIANLIIGANDDSMVITPRFMGAFPVDIPAGTRIAVRAQCTTTDTTDRKFDIVLYGIG